MPVGGRVFVFVVVLSEQVFAEIVGRVAPHRMDVIGLVLRIVELDQKSGAVKAVIVGLSRLHAAGPGEMNLFKSGGRYFGQVLVGQLWPQAIGVVFHQSHEQLLLRGGHVAGRQTDRRTGIGFAQSWW